MKKMRLDPDTLTVQGFTTGGEDGSGTVVGHDSTTDCTVTESGYDYCLDGGPTKQYSCEVTCPLLDTCSYTYCAPTCDHSMTSPCACV